MKSIIICHDLKVRGIVRAEARVTWWLGSGVRSYRPLPEERVQLLAAAVPHLRQQLGVDGACKGNEAVTLNA